MLLDFPKFLSAGARPRAVLRGVATTCGTKFELDGKDFYFAGSNAYYFPFNSNQDDVELGLTAAKDAGLKVFRAWGSHDKNWTHVDGGLPDYGGEGAGDTKIVFQWWENGNSTINLGPFDKVINAAKKTGIKLIVTLTNNWADYGGMDVYTVNLILPATPYQTTYKRYVEAMVTRYKDSDVIMAWEQANEPRCGADGGDFDAELSLPNIDFGTFHSYPDWWTKAAAWTGQWIRDHAAAMRRANKPVVHEEYGWLTSEARMENLGTVSHQSS